MVYFSALLLCEGKGKVPKEVYQRGKAAYTTYCSACHGANGKGANKGAFPPLAGSNWVSDKPDRSIQVVLHGLQGEIRVNRKAYDLVMPPQGAALSDRQISDILSYVRSSWGNKGGLVTAKQVAEARQQSVQRKTPWTEVEIKQQFGLPVVKSKHVKDNLIMHTYQGKWDKLPDFTQLEVAATEEEHSGFISLQNIHDEKNFGVVWEGELHAGSTHTYKFAIECTDGVRLVIDGNEVIRAGETSAKVREVQGGMSLERGWHKFRLEYFNVSGNPKLRLSMGVGGLSLISDPMEKAPRKTILLEAGKGKARLYRHFVKGATPYSVSVAYPEHVNLAFDTKSCAPVIMWRGDFIDAARHWIGRGQGWQPVASEHSSFFKQVCVLGKPAEFLAYKLDKHHFPRFRYKVGEEVLVTEYYKPLSDGFERTLTLENSGEPQKFDLNLLPDKGKSMQVTGKNGEALPKSLQLKSGESSLTFKYTWN